MIFLEAEKISEEVANEAIEEGVDKVTSLDFSNIAIEDLVKNLSTFGQKVLVAIIVFLIGRFIVKHICKIVSTLMKKRGVEASLQSFTDSLISISLNLLLAIVLISILGIETSTFVGLFAGAGVAIGMALSGTLQNFAGGVMILLFHPYKVGDFIEAQGFSGVVKSIQIFNTILTTVDNQTIIIPNGSISTGAMRVYSASELRRADINVEVAYGTNPDDVRAVLNKIAASDPRITRLEGTPMIAMGASSITIQFRAWTTFAEYWPVMGDTTEKIYKELTAAGIQIPFQQIDVHMK